MMWMEQYDPDSSSYRGPRCPECGSPCTIWFGPVPGRSCPVCEGQRDGEYRVYCTVTVKAANAGHAQQIVSEALLNVGRLVTAEPGERQNQP